MKHTRNLCSFKSQKKKSLKLDISEEDSFEKKQLENNLDDTEKFISGSQNLIKTSKVIVVDKSDQFRKVFTTYNYSKRFRQSSALLNQELDKIINRPQMKFDEIHLKNTPKTPFVKLKQSEIELKSCIKSNQFKESKKGIVLVLGKNTSPFDINVNKINVKRSYQIDNNIVQKEEPKNFTPLPLPGSITNNLLKMIKNNTKSPLFQNSSTKDSNFINISNNSRPSTSLIAKPRPKSKINKYSCILVTSQVDKLRKSFLSERVKSAAEAKNEFVNIVKLKDKRREYMENFKIKPHIDLIVAGDAYKRRVMSLARGTCTRMIDEFFKNDDNSFLIESKYGQKTIEERKSKIVIYKNILGSPTLKKHYDDDVQNNNLNLQTIQSNKVNEISFKTPNSHIKPKYFTNF